MLKLLDWKRKVYMHNNKILVECLQCLNATYKNWKNTKNNELISEMIRWATLAGIEYGKEEARHDLEQATNYKENFNKNRRNV